MFISVLELFKIGIGPSSSHTMGPMLAAATFVKFIDKSLNTSTAPKPFTLTCRLIGSLSATGKGHASDKAIALGFQGYTPENLPTKNLDALLKNVWQMTNVKLKSGLLVSFNADKNIIFDQGEALPQHPNAMIFELIDSANKVVKAETYFSIGGGFIATLKELSQLVAPLKMKPLASMVYGFDSAQAMVDMSEQSGLSIAKMKQKNEIAFISLKQLKQGVNAIWQSMAQCLEQGLKTNGILPGNLKISRRAQLLHQQLLNDESSADVNDWLCAYAMAVNEENAAGHRVVTAPTNGAAGVIPAVLYYFIKHKNGSLEQVHEFLLTASAIGGLIKHLSSISGAEVGCQGEVGTAAAMAAAGLCAIRGGSTQQIENAAEIALEHHLGMTCDPVMGLVQVPCIERNGFGAIKAYSAASLALRGSGQHFMSLDKCIAAMKQTGEEMSVKFKETSLGGLAVAVTEC